MCIIQISSLNFCCSSITPAFDGSNWTILNGAAAEYEDPLDDVVFVDVAE